MPNRSTVRHPRFDQQVELLAKEIDRLAEVIDGALWEIERSPSGSGVFIPQLDVWQARLIVPPDVLLFYSFNKRYVYALTIVLATRPSGMN